MFLAVAAALSTVAPRPARATLDEPTHDALLKLEAVLEMADLSDDLWPSWDISETPFVLLSRDSTCYLVNHPRPPVYFERVREDTDLRTHLYAAAARDVPTAGDCVLEDVPTGVLEAWRAGGEMLPLAFEAGFRAHCSSLCEDRMAPIELLSGYPVDAWNLVLADIECRLLHRAVNAPDDSLDICVREFASVRRHRRLRMGGRYAEFERRIEFTEGIPAYLAERCRREAGPYVGGRYGRRLRESLGTPGALDRCFPESPGLDWYRAERFRWTGAVICSMMDRYLPDWKEVARSDCVDAFEILWREVKGALPLASVVLERYGYEDLVASMTTTIEQSKSDAERMFESIVRTEGRTFSVATHLLASGEVRFDPTEVHKVDEHREVNTGLFKVEYSGGTHVYVTGIPVAIVLGDDEFDYRTLVVELPEEYSIVMDGVELDATDGVYEFMRSLEVTAPGFEVVAASGTIMVGERGATFVLHR